MKKACSVVSWLTYLIGYGALAGSLALGRLGVVKVCNTWGCHYETVRQPYPFIVWIIYIIFVVLGLFVLSYREVAVNRGNKTLAGVLTIIFASVPGGIMTLCIPDYQLVKRRHKLKNSGYSYGYSDRGTTPGAKMSPLDRANALSKLEDDYDLGLIDSETYQKRKAEIENK